MRTTRGNRFNVALLLCGAAMAMPFWAAPAMAQGAASDEANGNDIIVTAQRRNEKLEDVPMSVQVVTAATLANSGVNSVRDLANVTTGFQQNNSGIIPQITLRGVTSLAAGSYENNVAVFVDGLYQPTSQVVNMDLPNVNDIQVLKGPQGTLFGRNAMGGAILINTIDPGNEWTGNLEATYGRFNDRRARGAVSGPLGDKVGISLAGTFRKTDGYYKIASRSTVGAFTNGLGLEQESFRAKLKFQLSDTLRATFAYNFLRASDPRGALFTTIENVGTPYTDTATILGRKTRPSGRGEFAGDAGLLDYKQHEGSLKLELDTGIGTLRSITGYTDGRMNNEFDASGTYVVDGYSAQITRDRTWQESIDYNINAIKNVDLILGGNYYNIKSDYVPGHPQLAFAGPAGAPDPAITVTPLSSYLKSAETFFFRTKNAWAVFADATWHANDKLTITVGGRYSQETQDVSGSKNFYCAVAAGCTVGGVLLPVGSITSNPYTVATSAKRSSYNKFTPRASIRYEIAPRTNIYFSYSQGFRGGEWNGVIPSDNPNLWFDVKQETINSYEVGLKTASGRLHADISGFYYDYRNLQVSSTTFQLINGVNTALVILQNAPKAKIYGIDANFDYEVNDNLKIRAGATYLHARFGDGFVFNATGVSTNVGFNTNADVMRTLINASGLNQNLSGLPMPRSPNFSGFIGFDYKVPNKDGGLVFTANLKYTSSYVVTQPSVWGGDPNYVAKHLLDPNYLPDNTAQFTATAAGAPYVARASEQRGRQSGYALLNASVTWTDPSGHIYARVWGNNLTDKIYLVHYSATALGTYTPIGEPRTFGGTIGYRF